MIPTTSATVVPTEPSSLTVGPPAGAMESAAGTATPETVARCFASDSGVGRVFRQSRSLRRRRGHPSEITPSRIIRSVPPPQVEGSVLVYPSRSRQLRMVP